MIRVAIISCTFLSGCTTAKLTTEYSIIEPVKIMQRDTLYNVKVNYDWEQVVVGLTAGPALVDTLFDLTQRQLSIPETELGLFGYQRNEALLSANKVLNKAGCKLRTRPDDSTVFFRLHTALYVGDITCQN